MITDLVISQLPYVDGLPSDDSQKKIAWIKNGDPLLGASTFNGKDGQLNAAGVCISQNVQVQESNVKLSKDKINEIVTNVNNINDILAVSGNTPISIQVATNTSDIASLKSSVSVNTLNISVASDNLKVTSDKIGQKPSEDTGTRTVLDDLFWIKSEIGQYADKDINGNSVSGNAASGLKYRVITNTAAVAANDAKLTEIEALMESSDVEGTKADVKALRKEIGLSSAANSFTVYERLTRNESLSSTNETDITKIKAAIDLSNTKSIDSRVTSNTDSILSINKTLNDSSTGLTFRVSSLETQVTGTALGTLNSRVILNTSKVDSLNTVVGNSDSEGLRKEVKWIETQIGSSSGSSETPPTSSILGRLTILTSDVNQNASAIQDIQTDIGNNNEGIKGRVNTLSTKMDGTGSGSTIEGLGVFAYSKNLGTTKIDEAPNDGKPYARKSKAWVSLASSVASLALANKTITLTKTDAQIATSEFTASSVNTDVTVAAGLTVTSSGTYRVKFESDIVGAGNVQFTIKKGSGDVAVLNKYAKDATNAFIFGSAEEIVKVTSGDIFTVYVKALDDASAVSTQLNNIKLTLIPVF